MHAGHVRSVFFFFLIFVNLCIMTVLYHDCIVQPHHLLGFICEKCIHPSLCFHKSSPQTWTLQHFIGFFWSPERQMTFWNKATLYSILIYTDRQHIKVGSLVIFRRNSCYFSWQMHRLNRLLQSTSGAEDKMLWTEADHDACPEINEK